MKPVAVDIPWLSAWGATLSGSTPGQYFTLVKQFFGDFPGLVPERTTRDVLVRWCASVEPQWRQTKAISALDSYFGFLAERDLIERHPAPGLAGRVARDRQRRMLAGQLAAAGLRDHVIERITWREVVKVLAHHPDSIDGYLSPSLRSMLLDALLEKLRAESAETIDEALDRSIFA